MHLFTRLGFRRVTMDDLSKHLSVSKKTLYKFFLSKEHLLESIIDWKRNHIHGNVAKIIDNSEMPYIEKMNKVFEFITKEMSKFDIQFIEEIQFNKPELWEKLQQFKKESIYQFFGKLVQEGIDEGYLRDDVDKSVFIAMYYNTILNLMTPEFLSTVSYSNQEIYQMIIRVYFRGILTDQGRIEFKANLIDKGNP